MINQDKHLDPLKQKILLIFFPFAWQWSVFLFSFIVGSLTSKYYNSYIDFLLGIFVFIVGLVVAATGVALTNISYFKKYSKFKQFLILPITSIIYSAVIWLFFELAYPLSDFWYPAIIMIISGIIIMAIINMLSLTRIKN